MSKDYVLLVTGKGLGKGDEALGEKLMGAFFYSLNESTHLPSHILFLHGGVKLAVEDSPTIAVLNELEAKGVQIYACGTCLDYYGFRDQLKAGKTGNMYMTRDILAQAGKVINLG